MIAIPAKTYSKSDPALVGKILKRTSTLGVRNTASLYIQWNEEWAYKENWGYDWEYASADTNPGVIIGKLTGRYNVVGDKYECEVELFNHTWSEFGIPVRFIDWRTPILSGFYNDVDYQVLTDDGTVTGIVSKNHYSRDGHQNCFPHFDPDYFEFSDPEYWDTYFKSPDWKSGTGFIAYQHKLPRVKPVGSFNSSTGKSLEFISLRPHWSGGYLLNWGICLSDSNPLPTTEDIFLEATGDSRVFKPRGESRIYDLDPDTTYHVRLWHLREGNLSKGEDAEVEYYSDTILAATAATLQKPQLVIGATTRDLTSTSCQIRVGFDWIGDYDIEEAGLCWSTSINPTPANNKTIVGERQEMVAVFINLSGLLPATKYYVRTYVKIPGEIVYGTPDLSIQPIRNYAYRHPGYFTTSELLVPVLASSQVLQKFNIFASSAVISGQIANNGGAAIIAAGICWGKNTLPTKDNSFADADLSRGQFEEFYVDLTDLDPNATYYARVWVQTSAGIGYSNNEISFTTATGVVSELSISTNAVKEITTTSAVSGGHITDDGGKMITERGIVIKLESLAGFATVTDTKFVHPISIVGDFELQLTNLAINSSYKLRSYVIAGDETKYGNEIKFKTLNVETTSKPIVTTNPPSVVAPTEAVVSGTVVSNGGALILRKGFSYSVNSIAVTPAPVGTYIDVAGEVFEAKIENLTPNRLYKVRAYSINANGISWGLEQEFLTLGTVDIQKPTIELLPVFEVSKTGASVGGRITSKGGGTISRCGISWSTDPLPGAGIPMGSFEDNPYLPESFSAILSGLTTNTTYYIRAYAVNEAGISWSEQGEFDTLAENLLPVTISNTVAETLSNSLRIQVLIGNDDMSPLSDKGIVWGLDPSRLSNFISYGDYRSSFDAIFTRNDPGTYYVKAYAINAVGTSYATALLQLVVGMRDNTQFGIPDDPNITTYTYQARSWIRNQYGWALYRPATVTSAPEQVQVVQAPSRAKATVSTPMVQVNDLWRKTESKRMTIKSTRIISVEGTPSLYMYASEPIKFNLPTELVTLRAGDVELVGITLQPVDDEDAVLVYPNFTFENLAYDNIILFGSAIELESYGAENVSLLVPVSGEKIPVESIHNLPSPVAIDVVGEIGDSAEKAISQEFFSDKVVGIEASIAQINNTIIPGAISLNYPTRINLRNTYVQYIQATAGTQLSRSVLYVKDNPLDAVLRVAPDGQVFPLSPGKSIVNVIPILNNKAYRQVEIEVVAPVIRKVNTGIRFDSTNNIRLT